MKVQDGHALLTFGENVHPLHGGRARIEGFVVAGADHHFYPGQAVLARSNFVEVWSDFVPEPAAVRYAWATFPFGTLVHPEIGP